METRRLPRKFYTRSTLTVAKELLGKYLIRPIRPRPFSEKGGANGAKKIVTKKMIGKIVETEAYIGPEDKASHAYQGKITPRNKTEYLEGGHIYIYLCYGMYWQLNITTAKAGQPECVLIRALEPLNGQKRIKNYELGIKKLTNGPGKLCRWIKLDKSFDGEDLTRSKRIWLEDRSDSLPAQIKKGRIVAAKRIGIDYAGKWAKKPWRFYLRDNPFVSRMAGLVIRNRHPQRWRVS